MVENFLTKEDVKLHMFCARVQDRIVSESYYALIVRVNHGSSTTDLKFLKKITAIKFQTQ